MLRILLSLSSGLDRALTIFALYLDFEGAKKIHVLEVIMRGFGGRWMFLTWVWHFNHDLDMVNGL